jgi:hypothetical protein
LQPVPAEGEGPLLGGCFPLGLLEQARNFGLIQTQDDRGNERPGVRLARSPARFEVLKGKAGGFDALGTTGACAGRQPQKFGVSNLT